MTPAIPTANSSDALLASIRGIATTVAAQHAVDVDKSARFPSETFAALAQAGLLSAPVPRAFGGAGLGMRELGQLCAALSSACGSSGMVLAMHYIQVACIARHGAESAYFQQLMCDLVKYQWLCASITSEVGTFGDTRSSICALKTDGEQFSLDKDATTGSYCAHADIILVTCRRDESAPQNDQLLVLVKKPDYDLQQTTTWDTMGMRGTCSPGFKLSARGHIQQVLPGAFAQSAAQTMVPYSHILWSALWSGIANDALAKASSYVRSEARKNPGSVPPGASLLAKVSVQFQAMRNNWLTLANEFDALPADPEHAQLMSLAWALKMNNLKMACSEAAPQIVHQALQIIGIMAYKNDGPYALGRNYRDVLSASLMISNERIAAKSASMLLVYKDDAY